GLRGIRFSRCRNGSPTVRRHVRHRRPKRICCYLRPPCRLLADPQATAPRRTLPVVFHRSSTPRDRVRAANEPQDMVHRAQKSLRKRLSSCPGLDGYLESTAGAQLGLLPATQLTPSRPK